MDSAEPTKDSQPDATSLDADEASVEITLKFPPEKHTQKWAFSPTDTFEHLVLTLALEFPSYDWSKAKDVLTQTDKDRLVCVFLASCAATDFKNVSLHLPQL